MSQSHQAHTLPVYTDNDDLPLAPAPPRPSTHGTHSICAQHHERLPDRSTSIIL